MIRDKVHRHEDGRTEAQASASAPPPAAQAPIPPDRGCAVPAEASQIQPWAQPESPLTHSLLDTAALRS